jgi:hypothetical protein
MDAKFASDLRAGLSRVLDEVRSTDLSSARPFVSPQVGDMDLSYLWEPPLVTLQRAEQFLRDRHLLP